ncbi:MAG: hypothetical protein ACXADY_24240, partial [Candidatus Hodarchaeales archaeon]
SWSSNDLIVINVDGHSVGSYNYSIEVYDSYDNPTTDTVIVTVVDITAPVLTRPDDITYEEGDTGNDISWTATDLNPGNYTLYREDVVIKTGSWSSNDLIVINVDGHSVGSYNYSIEVYDSYDDTVIVIVTLPPTGTSSTTPPPPLPTTTSPTTPLPPLPTTTSPTTPLPPLPTPTSPTTTTTTNGNVPGFSWLSILLLIAVIISIRIKHLNK